MKQRRRARVDGLSVLAAAVTVVVVVVFGSMLARQRPLGVYYSLFLFQNGPSAVVLAWMSRLVLRRRPRHAAGLVLLAIALVHVTHTCVAAVADARLVAAGIDDPAALSSVASADLPLGASIPVWVMSWLWVPAPVLAVTVLPIVFPDGQLPSRRWRPVIATAATGGLVLMVAFMIEAWPTSEWTPDDTPLVVSMMIATGGLAVLGSAVASFIALGLRWRAADALRRRQFRLVGVTAGIFAMVVVATYPWQEVWIPGILVTFNGLLVAYALAAARYRLHDLEPVLGRAAVAATVSVLVAAVYATVIVGVGAFVSGGVENRMLPLVAVAVVALLLEPTRHRARRLVDRLLYRADADRTEVLSRLAARASTSVAAEDMLAEVTALLVRSTGAARAEAWLDTATTPQLAAVAGVSDEPAATLRAPVDHQGERLGELRLYARARADLVPDAAQQVADVARALGVVLRNDQLTAQLRDQLNELLASRQRLVEVHDHARRSLERDIHDGAQARLVALRLRLGVIHAHLQDTEHSQTVARELDDLGRDIDVAVRSLRDLARGLHPPILEQSGLAAALRAHSRGLQLPVSLSAHGVGRYPPTVEAAVYFSCLEAIQNAVRHSHATTITVELDADDAMLRFRVCDDGVGFDRHHLRAGAGLANIDDRVAALGGHTHIDTEPGTGTRVSGEIPAQPLTDDR